ncbi:MAG: methionine gamma-lyase family protein, partial [Clostridia bacterium]|nr:methionine gamma-lyase family protein [Clostridia bacterium]
MQFSDKILRLAEEAEIELRSIFEELDRVSFKNTAKIMDAFREHKVSDVMFNPTSGYGYDDKGRDTLDMIWADVMGAEKAFVRHNIVNGTHALTIAMFGLLRPGDTMISVAGKPYDTLEQVIGIAGNEGDGSLKDFGINYEQIELKDGVLDLEAIEKSITSPEKKVKVVWVQRSKGYLNRRT